jgi:hypothetical protein
VHLLVNGDSLPAPLDLKAGVAHRFRLVNIGVAFQFPFAIYRDSALVEWRRLARDGAELPAAQSLTEPSTAMIDVGETRDFELVPAPGDYRLVVGPPNAPLWSQLLRVR